MVDPNDVRAIKVARTELAKRGIDISKADVRVRNGICCIRGLVSRISGFEGDLAEELRTAAKVLRQRSEIKEVTLEISGLKM